MLRLPPYHPELNPIELIWAMVKNWVGRHNTAFNFNEVERLAREKFAAIGANEWGPICQKVERLELDLLQKEHTEEFLFQIFVSILFFFYFYFQY